MQACDFRNSFMFFEVDHSRATTVTAKQPVKHNQVRIPLECRCEVTAPGARGGTTEHYALTASCKTEKVAVERASGWIPTRTSASSAVIRRS
jgi:hypothetical protein